MWRFVGDLVVVVAVVALDPFPRDFVARLLLDQPLPQFDVLDGLLVRGAPAVALPAGHPLHDAVAHVAGIGVQDHRRRRVRAARSSIAPVSSIRLFVVQPRLRTGAFIGPDSAIPRPSRRDRDCPDRHHRSRSPQHRGRRSQGIRVPSRRCCDWVATAHPPLTIHNSHASNKLIGCTRMPARRRSLVVGLTVSLAVTTLTLAAPGAHASPCNALGPVGHDVGSTGSAASSRIGIGEPDFGLLGTGQEAADAAEEAEGRTEPNGPMGDRTLVPTAPTSGSRSPRPTSASRGTTAQPGADGLRRHLGQVQRCAGVAPNTMLRPRAAATSPRASPSRMRAQATSVRVLR